MKKEPKSFFCLNFDKASKALFLLALALMATMACAQTSGDIKYWINGQKFITSPDNVFRYQGNKYIKAEDGSAILYHWLKITGVTKVIVPDYAIDVQGNKYPVKTIADDVVSMKQKEGEYETSDSWNKCQLLVIGDNVEVIGENCFANFADDLMEGDSPNNPPLRTLVLGKKVTSIGDNTFQHFTHQFYNARLIVKGSLPPTLNGRYCFNYMIDNYTKYDMPVPANKQTKIYVQDEETYRRFVSDKNSKWSKFDYNETKQRKVAYTWPLPSMVTYEANKWVTGMFADNYTMGEFQALFGENAKVAKLDNASQADDGVQNIHLTFNLDGSVQADMPYLVKPSEDCVYVPTRDFTEGSVKCDVAGSNLSVKMIGVAEDTYLKDGEIYFRNNNGDLKFYYQSTTNGVGVRAGKCYFQVIDNATGETIKDKFRISAQSNTTGISDLQADMSQIDRQIYNLNGQLEGTDPSRLGKGIHIMNGKKFVRR